MKSVFRSVTGARLLDLRDGAPQFHGQGAKLLAADRAIACPAGLLKLGRRLADAGRADRQGGALELVRSGRQFRQIAGAFGRADQALRLDRRVAEFRQQGLDGGVIVAEPGSQHVAVECAGGSPSSLQSAPAGLAS